MEDLARLAERQPGQSRREQQRHGQSTYQGRTHGAGHGREQLVLDALEAKQRQIGSGDHAHAEEDGPRHLQRGRDGIAGRQGPLTLGLAPPQNVLDHHHRAVDQNAEIDGPSDRRLAGILAWCMKTKASSSAMGIVSATISRARAAQEQQQHQGHDDHAFGQGLAHGMRGALDQRGAVQIRYDLDIGRQQLFIEFLHCRVNAFQCLRGVRALEQQHNAFQCVGIVILAQNAAAFHIAIGQAPQVLTRIGVPLSEVLTTTLPISSSERSRPTPRTT